MAASSIMHLLKIFLLICIAAGVSGKVSGGGGGGGPNLSSKPMSFIEEPVLDRYKTQVCNAVPTFGSKNGKLTPLLDEMTEDEVFELAFINMAYGLNSDSISHLTEDLGYKKRVIDIITFITKQTCDQNIIPDHYTNAAKNMFLYYLYKRSKVPIVTKPGMNTTSKANTQFQWGEILNMLEQCSLNIDHISISEKCDDAASVLIAGEYVPIGIMTEQIDIDVKASGHEFMDEIIDAVWHFFSIAYARCYTLYYPKEDWVVQMFDNFRDEFLHPFAARWKKPGPFAEFFPLIFGPLDFRRARNNLKACKNAAYMVEGIYERQLVRPLTVVVDSVTMYNFKADMSLADE